ncbi:MAG TPA: farnesyl-diphosphate synthase [Rhodobiaceae bacterium]|nr:farnesyl-diphosphate synthase [Rhodobiaceae bacterium]
MRYTALAGGKGFRPFLCLASAQIFDAPEPAAIRVASAIECIHCYSLIHDDLPCMDDDDMRRGKPALHKAFDEATAILAGDALISLAFEILTDAATHDTATTRLELVAGLARASGMQGMVGGQMIDIMAARDTLDAGGLTRLQKMKTGALISFAVDAGAVLGGAEPSDRHALAGFAHDIGLAYQIADDVLDVEGDADHLGKSVGKDAAQDKSTFVSLLGVARAREQALQLSHQAVGYLDVFGARADPLREAAAFVIQRRS